MAHREELLIKSTRSNTSVQSCIICQVNISKRPQMKSLRWAVAQLLNELVQKTTWILVDSVQLLLKLVETLRLT
jgi:hypothetical protein